MSIQKIKLGNKELEFSFGLGFLGEALDEMDLGIDEIQGKLQKNPFKTVPLLMYHSAKYAKKRSGLPEEFSFSEIIDMIDSSGGMQGSGVVGFLEAFTDSLLKGVPKSTDETEEDSKKK